MELDRSRKRDALGGLLLGAEARRVGRRRGRESAGERARNRERRSIFELGPRVDLAAERGLDALLGSELPRLGLIHLCDFEGAPRPFAIDHDTAQLSAGEPLRSLPFQEEAATIGLDAGVVRLVAEPIDQGGSEGDECRGGGAEQEKAEQGTDDDS